MFHFLFVSSKFNDYYHLIIYTEPLKHQKRRQENLHMQNLEINMFHQGYIILRIRRLEGKHCRPR